MLFALSNTDGVSSCLLSAHHNPDDPSLPSVSLSEPSVWFVSCFIVFTTCSRSYNMRQCALIGKLTNDSAPADPSYFYRQSFAASLCFSFEPTSKEYATDLAKQPHNITHDGQLWMKRIKPDGAGIDCVHSSSLSKPGTCISHNAQKRPANFFLKTLYYNLSTW